MLFVCVRSVVDLTLLLIVGPFAPENAETCSAQLDVLKFTVTNFVASGTQDL